MLIHDWNYRYCADVMMLLPTAEWRILMSTIICLKHPNYNKSMPPDLNCITCCRAFVDSSRQEANFDASSWLEKKMKPNMPPPTEHI